MSSGSMTPIAASDLYVGKLFELGDYTVDHDEIVEFATRWDPMPIHIDEDAAAVGPFGELVGSGLHMIAILTRLGSIGVVTKSTVVAGRGVDTVRFWKPLRAGTVTARMVVETMTPRSRGGSIVTVRMALYDAARDLLCDMLGEMIWA